MISISPPDTGRQSKWRRFGWPRRVSRILRMDSLSPVTMAPEIAGRTDDMSIWSCRSSSPLSVSASRTVTVMSRIDAAAASTMAAPSDNRAANVSRDHSRTRRYSSPISIFRVPRTYSMRRTRQKFFWMLRLCSPATIWIKPQETCLFSYVVGRRHFCPEEKFSPVSAHVQVSADVAPTNKAGFRQIHTFDADRRDRLA